MVTAATEEPGLVTSATTGRGTALPAAAVPDAPPDLSELWRTRFPEPDDVSGAAARFPGYADRPRRCSDTGLPGLTQDYRTGPVPRLLISPGVLRVEVADLGKREATAVRDLYKRAQRADLAAADWRMRQARAGRSMLSTVALLAPDVLDSDGWGDFRRDRDRQLEALALQTGIPLAVRWSSRVITQWSRKSRSRMVRTLAELDYSAIVKAGRVPCFLTLTLPDAWETVAPTGKEFKRFVAMLRRRWERAWDEPLIGIWKLEFQRRGAPHLHVFTVTPLGMVAGEARRNRDQRYRPAVGDGLYGNRWLLAVWADIVDHPDPENRRLHEQAGTRVDIAEGLRMTDPKRVCVYFSKHGTFRDKEYQHIVPPAWREPDAGPGRFWGYWGLEKVTEPVELTFDERLAVARTLRRYGRAASRGRGAVMECDVIRGGRFRKVHRRVPDRLQSCSGFLCVNDGPRLARALSRLVMGGDEDGKSFAGQAGRLP
jgi:hypothetical protein